MKNNTQVNGVEQEIKDMAAELGKLPRNNQGKIQRVPPEMKKRLVQLWRVSGISREEMAKRVGLSGVSVGAWVMQFGKTAKSKQLVPVNTGILKFKQVQVTKTRAKQSERMTSRTYVLEMPGGGRITGLGLDDVRMLLR